MYFPTKELGGKAKCRQFNRFWIFVSSFPSFGRGFDSTASAPRFSGRKRTSMSGTMGPRTRRRSQPAHLRVEHQVKITDFMKWLERPGRTPREITQRLRIRSILGMSVSR
jgi:hypothetical protein